MSDKAQRQLLSLDSSLKSVWRWPFLSSNPGACEWAADLDLVNKIFTLAVLPLNTSRIRRLAVATANENDRRI